MITRYEAYIDGIPLSDLAPEIIVKDIAEKEAKTSETTYMLARGEGSRIFRRARESLSVSVKFEIRAYNVERRQSIMEQVHLWASGRYLSVNTRPGKRLPVIVDDMPVVLSALKWTQEITITFVSRESPFWEDENTTNLVFTGMSGNGILRPTGSVEKTHVEFVVTNKSNATMDAFSASVGEYTMSFRNLGVLAGESFSLEYVDGVQILPVESRTVESADELWAKCNANNEVSFTASQNAEVVFSVRGRYN